MKIIDYIDNKLIKNKLIATWLLIQIFDLLYRGFPFLTQNITGFRFISNFLMSSLFLITLLYIISYIRKKWLFITIFFALVAIPMILNGSYFLIYRKFISASAFNIFANSPEMVLTTSANNFNYLFLIISIFISLVSAHWLWQFKPTRKWLIIPNSLILLTTFIILLLHWYSVSFFQVSSEAFVSNLTEELLLSNQKSEHPNRLKLSDIKQNKNNPNIIFVIGESQVASHMSLYGYKRKNTPKLDSLYKNGEIVPFKKAVSIGNKTRYSVPYMLVGLQGPDPKGLFYSIPTLFDYAKAVGYHTMFISAQDLQWGHLDRLFDDGSIDLLLDGNHFSSKVDVHKGVDDLVLLPKLFNFIKKSKKPYLLVVQMDGSHYPYNIHSPKKLKKYLPEKDANCINAYDNTIIVTDLFLSGLHNFIRKESPNTYMFFTPDHGQNLGGINGKFNDSFTPLIFHNALIAFTPQNDTVNHNLLLKNQNKLVSQADIFPTILELMSLKSRYKIDGFSLLDTTKHNRLICCSGYMPTFNNNPQCAVVDTTLQTIFIDFAKKSVTDNKTNKTTSLKNLDPKVDSVLQYRLNRLKPIELK